MTDYRCGFLDGALLGLVCGWLFGILPEFANYGIVALGVVGLVATVWLKARKK